MATILKVSVLGDGSVLLDGAPVVLAELETALDAAGEGAAVWYYRENAAGEAPANVLEVMKLITGKRLPVRLSTKPDFSDTAAPQSKSAQIFAAVRARAAKGQIAIVRPDLHVLLLPAPKREAVPPAAVAEVERLLPPSTRRKVAAIADTSWAMEEKPNLQAAGRAVPFFGLLMGFSTIGHAVWLFDGQAVAEGCAEANLAIVDGALVATLAPGWERMAPVVRVFDRETRHLRKV